ncbi:MAG: hypothetical protein Q8O82_15960 [Pseudorhodobacter sp.]|nr:hypothetical protein [Pseudorhodobacter sp.]NCM96459.1 hypothetical protein [Rhodobacterales bacterium]NCO15831.1 hypothetical protein [Alphaproteobacteria bacterium]OIQ06550.1 MAG: hypothetical protein AUK60_07000 [Rhodobacteraceae bacterium CG2_30_10_405]
MIGLVYLVVFGLLGLSLVYLLVSVYSRSVRREKLEKRFDAGDGEGDRDAYIEAGMKAYQHGLRRRLIWLVYIIPIVVVGVTIYLVNY